MDVPAKTARRSTLAMVAAASGVTTSTVSKVLNGRPDVAADTRTRVQQALRDHEYVPPATRSFKMQSRTVELVFSDYRNPYFGEILHGVTGRGATAGIDVVVGRPLDSGRAWARRMVRGAREGAIVVTSELTPEQLRAFDAAGRSLVVIDPINMPKIDIPSIGATNWAGGMSAAQHLIDLGHRQIAFLGGPPEPRAAKPACTAAGRPWTNSGFALRPRAHVARRLRPRQRLWNARNGSCPCPRRPPPYSRPVIPSPSASWSMARQRGRRYRRLSVVGFDGTYVAAWSCPPLTTVHQPLQEMGRATVRVLLALADGSAPDRPPVELAAHLVVHSSTRHLATRTR